MVEYERRLIIQEENWRDFFRGSFHQKLSLSLSEAYSQILKVCINEKLVLDPKGEINRISLLDSKDLSDTTNLIFSRFQTCLPNSYGKQMILSPSQVLNKSLKIRGAEEWSSDLAQIRASLQKSRELENISSVIKLGRNLNAHIQTELLDLGLSFQICSAILRLFEIFHFEHVSSENIQELQKEAEKIIINSFGDSRITNKQANEVDANIENVDVVGELDENFEEDFGEEEQSIENDYHEEPLNSKISTPELQKQNLDRLNLSVRKKLRDKGFEFSHKELILSGSTLTDIIRFKPKKIQDLYAVFAVKILLEINPEIVEFQIENFGKDIVSEF